MPKRQQKHTEDDERRQGPPEAMIQPEDVDAAIGEGGTAWERFERMVRVVLTADRSTLQSEADRG